MSVAAAAGAGAEIAAISRSDFFAGAGFAAAAGRLDRLADFAVIGAERVAFSVSFAARGDLCVGAVDRAGFSDGADRAAP
jgi:hypothetical protein